MQRELLLGCSGWAPAPQDLTVKSLRIVDAEGRTRIKLDCAGEYLTRHDRPQIVLCDAEGYDRVWLRLGGSDIPSLPLIDSKGAPNWFVQSGEGFKPLVGAFGDDLFQDIKLPTEVE